MKVYSTKYAFTTGIECFPNAEQISPSMVRVGKEWGGSYLHHGDWHVSAESAIQRAEEMRVKKIASMRKKLAKLETMVFEVKQ